MRALQLGGYADKPSTLLGTHADPVPGPNDVRIRIEAAAFNPLDSKLAKGWFKDWFPISFPYVPGTDFAGIVEEVGETVHDISVGDEVFGRADPVEGGAFAERIVISTGRIARRPKMLTAQIAACLPTPAGMALQGIEALGRSGDEPFLILGDGAVARAAKAIGGAFATMAASEEDLPKALSFQYVLDAAGGGLQRAVLEKLAPGSHVVGIVMPIDEETVSRLGIHAQFSVLETSRKQLDTLGRLAVDGVLQPVIDRVITLDETASAFDRYVAREISGKTIITGDRA